MSENQFPVQENAQVQETPPVEQATSATGEPLPKKFCHSCDAEVGDTRFCPKCGIDLTAPIEANPFNAEAEDIAKNKMYGILSYLGILALVPLFAAKDSPFARFHCNQGLVLLIANVAVVVLKSIIHTLPSILYTILNLGLSGISICVAVFAIMGLVYACKGEKKALPIIGDIQILK